MVNKFLYPAGGAETYLFQLGKYWEEQGNEVTVFASELIPTDHIIEHLKK